MSAVAKSENCMHPLIQRHGPYSTKFLLVRSMCGAILTLVLLQTPISDCVPDSLREKRDNFRAQYSILNHLLYIYSKRLEHEQGQCNVLANGSC